MRDSPGFGSLPVSVPDPSFEEDGDGTRVTQRSEVSGKGLTKLMFFLFGWMMKRSGCDARKKELASLKAYCESREA